MKTAAIALLALSAVSSSAFAASDNSANIQVNAPTAREALANSVNRAIDRRLTRNLRLLAFSNSFERGFVTVQFRTDAMGRVNSVAVTRPSGSRRFDNLAVRSVQRMDIGALPAGIAADQVLVAHIIVSSDQELIEKYRTEIADAAKSPAHLAGNAVTVSVVNPG